MAPLVTLDPACTPRRSVFEQRGQDTVYNLDDLSQIEPGPFFTETYVTEGMQVLLTEAFKRLEGKTSSASGTFLLSQSMGGGKTHNLIALGLLARHPEYRERVMGRFYDPGPLGAVRVVSFSGRKTNTPFGIWGEIAEQLNKRDVLRDFYSPLRPPGAGDWVDLLRGEPLLLLVAVNGNKLPQACVVLTDLSGAAYRAGGAAISEALTDLEHEVDRGVVRIDPVRLTTNELYYILRTRLFETLPTDGEIDAVADAYREAVERARLMDI